MKNTHLLFFFFSCFAFFSGTQDIFSQSQFQLVVRDSSNEGVEARSIIQTTDGGFAIAGETGIDMYIVKLNSAGQIQWSRTIGGGGIALSVVQTTDGGFAVSGYGGLSGGSVYGPLIVKLTPGGSVEWSRVLVGDFLGAAYSIVETADGGYAALNSLSVGGGYSSLTIVKLNSMGSLLWSKKISGWTYGRSIKQTLDRGFIVAGATGLPFDMLLVKLDSNGTLQWAKTVGGPDDDFAYSVVQSTDGGYAVAGYTYSFLNAQKNYLAKFDGSGSLQWTKVIGENLGHAYSIVQTIDGGYALGGYTGGGPSGMLILKLTPVGSLQWSRVVRGSSSVPTYAYSLIQTSDGGFAAAGFGGILGAMGMMIVKLDNNGNTCGNTISHNIIESSGGILGSSIPSITSITLTDTLITPTTGTHGFVTPLCVIGIQPISNEIPSAYRLYQNYPNPFNPVTKIKFDISGTLVAQTFLSVYDMLGREVDILVNTDLHPGTYEVDWDGSNYASGVYYYRLSVLNSGSSVKYQETKRMLLIK